MQFKNNSPQQDDMADFIAYTLALIAIFIMALLNK